ncbi:MAG TPA: hypothetical protein VFZ59_01290 [Verrucomicrobiae bacterium]|nr:hypothetical protein [Verrucomicrobiae bacterium]
MSSVISWLRPVIALLAMGLTMADAADGLTSRRSGVVRVVDHTLVDDGGPFLGLGVSYFTALGRCRSDRARLESDLKFLSEQGFDYYRMFSMVGWYPAWAGLEIAPVTFTNRVGKRIEAWPDYWKQVAELIDLAYDRYRLRAQITIFADAQLMPARQNRIEHMRRLLTEVVPGREHKIILLEVANEAWQNGFPGEQGVVDLREFTKYLAERTAVLVATTSNHEDDFAKIYANSSADIATWHFSRDRARDNGWKPVYDCWNFGDRPGFPPAISNEPIGPGASVATESSSIRLVMAAAFAYTARLPMYVFHSEAGVFGQARFEDTPAIREFRFLKDILPSDLPNWRRNDGRQNEAPFTVFANGQPNCYISEASTSRDGCVRNIGSRKGDQFVCIPIGLRAGGLQLEAREALEFNAIDPLSGKLVHSAKMNRGERVHLPAGAGGLILKGRSSPVTRK